MQLWYIIAATLLISTGSFLGVFTLNIKKTKLSSVLHSLVAISAGALLATSLLDLLPEALENLSPQLAFSTLLLTFVIFVFIEKILHWRHCHNGECEIHTFGYTNLIGDTIHNFIDGLIIASAFSVDTQTGVVTTLAVALHEIPQEISDYGVLVYSGFKQRTALIFNVIASLTSVLGGIIGFYTISQIEPAIPYLLTIAAGSFLYISASDLIPELRNQTNPTKLAQGFFLFLLGIILIIFVGYLTPHTHTHSQTDQYIYSTDHRIDHMDEDEEH